MLIMKTEIKPTWICKAFCTISETRPEFIDGFRGAYVVIACLASDISEATCSIADELFESGLIVKGFDHLFDTLYIDRSLSEYEEALISRLESYPIQFEDVHFFKPDT
jgi:hypothetical protein